LLNTMPRMFKLVARSGWNASGLRVTSWRYSSNASRMAASAASRCPMLPKIAPRLFKLFARPWVKAGPATVSLAVRVSLHARPGYVRARASFAAGFHGAVLRSATIACADDLTASCTLGATHAVTGRPHIVAESKDVAFVVVLIPGSAVKVGRNHLWHVREEIRASLPADLRELLTGHRTGTLSIRA
jgi:hypothetical protein